MKFWEAIREMEENGKICTMDGVILYRILNGRIQNLDDSPEPLKKWFGWSESNLVFDPKANWRIVDKWKTVQWWEAIKWMGKNRGRFARYRAPSQFKGEEGIWVNTVWPEGKYHQLDSNFTDCAWEFQIPNE